jgi:RNA polymerase subunit RPABC4/transcription elongation factor Spt4
MAIAAKTLKVHFNSFKKRALELGCYKPNQSGKGTHKHKAEGVGKIPLSEILEGKHPSYQTFKLKRRLLQEGIKDNECEVCHQNRMWQGKPLNCELDHIDGDDSNHRLKNLQMICPNCHSQTTTYRAKNRK